MRTCKECPLPTAYDNSLRLCRGHFNEYHRKYRKENKARVLEIHRESRNAIYKTSWVQRWKDKANDAVRKAIHRGDIKRSPCEKCGFYKSQAHHPSYLKRDWLKITFLCQSCHAAWHRENRPKTPTKAYK